MDESNLLDIKDMQAVAHGNTEAFQGIVERNQAILMNFFRRLGASPSRAEDLAQDTFLRLYDWRRRYEPKAKFRTFLFVLARHVWIDACRKDGRTIRTTHEDAAPEVEAPRQPVEDMELHLDLKEALGQLPQKLRLVVELNVYNGLNYAEIGEILEIPEGTVKSRMYYALRRLREFLEGHGP